MSVEEHWISTLDCCFVMRLVWVFFFFLKHTSGLVDIVFPREMAADVALFHVQAIIMKSMIT